MASNSRRNEIFNYNDVINSNDLRKRIVNVDSRFRDTNPLDTTSNFQYTFEHPYKNTIRIRIASVEIPNSWYNFNTTTYHNTFFAISAYDISNNLRTEIIRIANGNYSNAQLIDAIQTQLTAVFQVPYGIFLNISVNPISQKTTIALTGVGPTGSPTPTTTGQPFTLNFIVFSPNTPTEYTVTNNSTTQYYDGGLGMNLGFKNIRYNVSTVIDTSGGISTYGIVSPFLINTLQIPYVLLAINDYYTVENNSNKQFTQALAKILVQGTKNTIIFDEGLTMLSNDIIFPSPTDLKRIKVTLLDPYGQAVDLNGLNLSFSMEITEVTNTKMYEFYRNYIWLGTVPSLPSNVTGSGQGLLGGKGP
jgi:hypothetical protein